MDSPAVLVRTRLSIMMFLEFFVWASWLSPIATYLSKTCEFTGGQIGWIFSTTALGAIISPLFVGYVADRLFATERILCVLHLVGGAALLLAAGQTTFAPLMTLMMVNALAFMPTLALGNSLAFRNIPDPEKFPRIAVLGTIGWIVSGLIVGIVLSETNNWFFYLAGATELVLAFYCLTLPHTPPKGREAGGDVLGLGALGLLRDPAFLVFTLSAFLISIPALSYFVHCNPFLTETERPAPTALMTLSQVSEIFVMFTMPWFTARLGLTRVLSLGMAAWAIRYLLFATMQFPLVVVALLLHGFCYCFVYVGAYIYVDKMAPRDQRASAQSLIAFLMLGVGWFAGSKVAGFTKDCYPPVIAAMPATEQTEQGQVPVTAAPLPPWRASKSAESPWSVLDLQATFRRMISGQQAAAAEPDDLGRLVDTDRDSILTAEEIKNIPADGLRLEVGGKTYLYAKSELEKVFREIDQRAAEARARHLAAAGGAPAEGIGRVEYVAAQAHDWPPIWWWPARAAVVVCALFSLGARRKPPDESAAA